MKSCLAAVLIVPFVALPAAGQSKRAKVVPPAAMMGVWGVDENACKGASAEAENRIEVEKEGVGLYVTYYGLRAWRRSGDVYGGRATMAEEGEDKPAPGTHRIALRLLRDGRLELRVNRDAASVYVKCPPGVYVR